MKKPDAVAKINPTNAPQEKYVIQAQIDAATSKKHVADVQHQYAKYHPPFIPHLTIHPFLIIPAPVLINHVRVRIHPHQLIAEA
jgi:hypothetical protein